MSESIGPVDQASVGLIKNPQVRRLLVIALLAEIGYAALNLSTMPVYLKNDRAFGASVIGLVLTAFLLSEAIFKSVMGHLSDRYGTKNLMLAGPVLSVFTSLMSLAVPRLSAAPVEVLAFVVLRALDGVAIAMLWPAAFAEMNSTVKDDQRQQAMSLLNLCYMLGIALAFPIGGIANDLAKVRWAGLVLAAMLFAGVAIFVWRSIEGKAQKVEPDPHGSGLADFIASMRQIPEFLLLAVVTFAGIGFPTYIFKLFPTEQFQLSETQIGALIFPGAIAMAVASVPMSKIGERMGRIRAVHMGLMLCFAGMVAIGSGAFLPFLRSPWILALGGIPVGIGFLLTIPAWMASVSDINPERRGANLGAVMTAQGLGAIFGAPIGAAMYEKLQPLGVQLGLGADFGRYSPFVGCAICVGLGWMLSLKVLHRPAPLTAPLLPNDSEVLVTVAPFDVPAQSEDAEADTGDENQILDAELVEDLSRPARDADPN